MNKAILISLSIILAGFNLLMGQNPQPSYTLSQPESGNKTYIARDYISLKPGFQYTATGNQSFNARIDQCLLFPPTTNTYAKPDGTITNNPSEGGVVGAIPGAFNVSPTGAATYTIPIEVPPGINGMQPNLSLVYNSQAGNGIAGWGWNIGGISMISRVPKSFYYDGQVSGIDWTKDSPLALDGQRLIKISDTEYRTENESFSKITAKNIQSWGPEVITATTKDGLTMEYGRQGSSISYSPISSTKRLGWLLCKIYDQLGNYVEFNYSYVGGITYRDLVVQSVTYGSEIGGQAVAVGHVVFFYKERTDRIEGYIDDVINSNSRLLDKIEVKSYNTLLKVYELKYSFDGSYSQLTEVGLRNDLGEQLNPIVVQWQKDGQPYSKIGSEDFAFLSSNVTERPIYGDFNGNGRRDFITYKNGLVSLYINNDSWGAVNFTKECEFTIYGDNPKGVIPADLNGDGKLDLIAITQAPNGTYRYNYYFSDGKSFSNGGGSGYKGFNTTKKDNDYIIGDFNGDGKHNILIKSTLNVYNDAGSIIGSGGIPNWGKELVPSFPNNRYLIDFTGNGRTNICILDNSQARIYELVNGTFSLIYTTSLVYNLLGILPGDFNSDGKTDLLIQRVNSNAPDGHDYYILFATGNAFIRKDLPNLDLSDKTFMADFNLDGKTDLVVCKPDYSNGSSPDDITIKFAVGTYNGSSFSFTEFPSNMKYLYYNQGGYQKASMYYIDIADYTGDGRMEICYDRYSDVRFIRSFNDASHLHISQITNGLGESTMLDFAPITGYVYSESTNANYSYPVVSYRIPLYVVSNSHSYGSINKSISYNYKDILIHKQGKGILGFLSISEKDWQTRIETKSVNTHNSIFQVLVPSLNQTFLETTLLNQTSYSISLIGLGSKRYNTRTNTITNTNFLINTTQNQSFSNYDNFGNPQTITTSYGEGLIKKQEITYVQSGSWCANKVGTIKTTFTNSSGSDVVEKHFDYFTNGQLKKETVHPGKGSFEVNTEYSYDNFGNVTKIKVSNNGQIRQTEMTYTPSGRFLKTKKNLELGEEVTFNYDETRALLMSETSQIGTSTYQYDGFGRLIKTKYPDNVETINALQWAGGDGPTGAKYYAYTETSGQSPVKVWYDGLSREIRRDFYGLNEELTSVTTEYNTKGQVYRVSEPYFTSSGPTVWAVVNTYYNDGRIKQVETPAGTTSYAYSNLKTTVTTPSGVTETTLNAAGQVLSSKVDGKTVTYSYFPNGLTKSATPEGLTAVTFEYDLAGNRTKIVDPNAGTIETKYNGLGQLVERKQKIHSETEVITTYNYLPSGLIDEINLNGEITKHEYDSRNRLKKVTLGGNVHVKDYNYDDFNRPVSVTETIENSKIFNFSTEYDAFGRVTKETWPTGYFTTNQYDKYGLLKSITDQSGEKLFEATEANAKGQLKKYKQGGREVSIDYHNQWNMPTSMVAPGVMSMHYQYNNKGNLESRYDYLTHQEERFLYDGANRLYSYEIFKNDVSAQTYNITYDPATGGIANKPYVGFDMAYQGDGKPPHALSRVSGIPASIGEAPQDIEYTDFSKVKRITQGNKTHQITYGVDRQRIKGTFATSGNTTLTKYYLGSYEEEHKPDGSIRKLHYIYAGNPETSGQAGLTAIMVKNGSTDSLYYTYCDYQGNLLAVTDALGNVKEKLAYDPWGLRRSPSNWTQTDSRTSFLFSRGYTMHEHLDHFGLINMNGRVYDPIMAQFLSPDPFIQAPGNWYNYNRYGYCLNNPLIYTDPSGELWWLVGAFIGGAIANKSLNPFKWNFKEPTTWFGMIGGALLGQAAMGPGGWFASGGQGVNIALGANINNLVAPMAKFTVSNSGLAFKGLGYVTAAGGGLWLINSNIDRSIENVYKGIDYARKANSKLKEYWNNSDFYFEHSLQTSIGVQAGFGIEYNDLKGKINLNLASVDLYSYKGVQVGNDSNPWQHENRWIGKDEYGTVRQSVQIPFLGYEHSFNTRGEGYIYGSQKHSYNILGFVPDNISKDYSVKVGVDAKFIFGISYYVRFGRRGR